MLEVDLWKLQRTWYVTHGYNPDYDCFACQKLSFDYDWSLPEDPIELNTVYDVIAMNGSLIWNDNQMKGDQQSGMITLKGRDNGLNTNQRWFLLLLTEDTLVVYHCGEVQ